VSLSRLLALLLPIALAVLTFSSPQESSRQPVVLIDRVYGEPGSRVTVTVLLEGMRDVRSVTVRLLRGAEPLYGVSMPAAPLVNVTLTLPEAEGLYAVEVLANISEAAVLARVVEPLPVVRVGAWGEPLLVCFVWHNHQGINIMPDGTFHGPWAFVHVYESQFAPYYPEGAYSLHATLLEKHPRMRVTINWSPSLLWQWLYALRFGYYDGLRRVQVPPDSGEIAAVGALLERLRSLAAGGRMEVLTSYFNHPIPGYVAEKFEWGLEALEEELEWGLTVTKLAFNTTPRGAWIPEMFFSMKLTPMLVDHGIQYTVLDARYHLSSARGDVATPYEPYLLESGGRKLTVFFRDSEISDFISFGINPQDHAEAEALARRVAALIVSRRLENPEARVVVIAADGENWLFGNSLKAVFLDKLYGYVTGSEPVLEAATLSEALQRAQPWRILSWVPTNSWAGGDWVWTSRSENAAQWSMIAEAGRKYAEVKRTCKDPGICTATAFSLFMALNSDVIHIEYTMLPHTHTWSTQVEMICRQGAKESEKLLQKHFTPNLEKLNVHTDCRVCEPSLTEYLPQITIGLLLIVVAVLIAYARKRRQTLW